MKAVLQRVTRASVKVDGNIVGEIGNGFLVLLGAGDGDTNADCEKLADKISKIRLFEDEQGKMNLSAADINGEILVISQFTLYADSRKGNRPNFMNAMEPVEAERLYEYFLSLLEGKFSSIQKGIFGADMKVELLNDGPVTIILETRDGNII